VGQVSADLIKTRSSYFFPPLPPPPFPPLTARLRLLAPPPKALVRLPLARQGQRGQSAQHGALFLGDWRFPVEYLLIFFLRAPSRYLALHIGPARVLYAMLFCAGRLSQGCQAVRCCWVWSLRALGLAAWQRLAKRLLRLFPLVLFVPDMQGRACRLHRF